MKKHFLQPILVQHYPILSELTCKWPIVRFFGFCKLSGTTNTNPYFSELSTEFVLLNDYSHM